jgi:iron complex transport system substrate-binding protein
MFAHRSVFRAATVPLLLITLALAACGDDSPTAATDSPPGPATDASAAFPVTIAGSDGHELVLDSRPARIVSYSPGATEALFAIGAGEQVIAADEFSDFPSETARLERVSYANPDPERLLAVEPDLVILATRQNEQVEQLRGLGVPVLLANEPDSVEGVFEAITLLGTATGHEHEATALVEEMRGRFDAVAARIADVGDGPTVFYELSDDLYTVAPETFIGGMLGLLRAQNVAAGAVSPFPQLSSEAVIAANPDVILLADAEHGPNAESVSSRPGWSGIAAVAEGRIHSIDPDLVNRPGPRIAEGIEVMARLLYPDRFGE